MDFTITIDDTLVPGIIATANLEGKDPEDVVACKWVEFVSHGSALGDGREVGVDVVRQSQRGHRGASRAAVLVHHASEVTASVGHADVVVRWNFQTLNNWDRIPTVILDLYLIADSDRSSDLNICYWVLDKVFHGLDCPD